MIIFLQASRSLAEPHSSVSVHFVTALMSSSQHARDLPLFLVPPPIPSIIDFSKLFSLRMICPKYDSCCLFINVSNGLVALISSITDVLVHFAVHNSKLSIILLSAFLIVHDSQPYSTTGKTNAFTILHFVAIVIALYFHILLALSLPLCLKPIVSKCHLYRNPSLQFWDRGRQNPVLLLLSPPSTSNSSISSVDMTSVFFRFK